jgi:hypothetical protein
MSCAACQRRIGEHDRHWIIAADLRVIGYPCGSGGTVKNCTAVLNHLLVFPGCGVEWHDIHDHAKIWSRSAEDTRRWLAATPRRAQFVGNLGIMAGRTGAP